LSDFFRKVCRRVVEQNCNCRKKISSELPKRIEKKKERRRKRGE
jgi:hypothetical protein